MPGLSEVDRTPLARSRRRDEIWCTLRHLVLQPGSLQCGLNLLLELQALCVAYIWLQRHEQLADVDLCSAKRRP